MAIGWTNETGEGENAPHVMTTGVPHTHESGLQDGMGRSSGPTSEVAGASPAAPGLRQQQVSSQGVHTMATLYPFLVQARPTTARSRTGTWCWQTWGEAAELVWMSCTWQRESQAGGLGLFRHTQQGMGNTQSQPQAGERGAPAVAAAWQPASLHVYLPF